VVVEGGSAEGNLAAVRIGSARCASEFPLHWGPDGLGNRIKLLLGWPEVISVMHGRGGAWTTYNLRHPLIYTGFRFGDRLHAACVVIRERGP
jgi:hypothetical protein